MELTHKLCSKCGVDKPISEFRIKTWGRYHSQCKSCMKVAAALVSKDITNIRKRKNRNARIDQRRLFVYDYLLDHPCACGEKDPIVLTFDHLEQATKKANIVQMVVMGASFEKLKAEMEKCRILCSNCHARRTAEQLGWRILKLVADRNELKLAIAS